MIGALLSSVCPKLQSLAFSSTRASDNRLLSLLSTTVEPLPSHMTPISDRIASLDLGSHPALLPSTLRRLATSLPNMRHFSLRSNNILSSPNAIDDLRGFFELVGRRNHLQTLTARSSPSFMDVDVVTTMVRCCASSLTKLDFGDRAAKMDRSADPLHYGPFSRTPIPSWGALNALTGLTNLAHLRLPGLQGVFDTGAMLKRMPSLVALDVSGCKNLKDQVLRELAEFCFLVRWIDVAGCEWIGDKALFGLGKESSVPYLTALDICGTDVSEQRLGWLVGRCSSLMKPRSLGPRTSRTSTGDSGRV
ncbi:RNI-like protein [Gonapodya prolifera JEL478]|uniref:RNI-like protein n=1 Tax=Gonapodya prolifera (strain JEL478) TaxID=1344416 RepID=A0A139AKU2_GONPJ|nr:RNI-like protein [Gonapodya prolifera JEL478]|eukprot:KXS17045.1 RNI-like protein [Gonapodya prolifera JEL478]